VSAAAALGLSRVGRAAATTPGVFNRQPYLQRLLADRVSVLWTAAQPGAGSVVVLAPDGSETAFSAGITAFQPSTTQMPAVYYQYQADITGLGAGTAYQYQVLLDGQIAASDPVLNSFSTPAVGDFSFLAFGDSGTDSPEQLALVQQMAAETGIAKVLHLGDLAYYAGMFSQFESNYFGPNAPLMSRLPFFATPGNHDYDTANGAAFLAGHAAPAGNVPAADQGRYYSYDWGDAHFVSVDSNLLATDAATRMMNWLASDLAASGKYWKIVFLHHPPYPTGFHVGDPICVMVQQNVIPILESNGVQLVLSGHEHGYERSFPLVANQPVNAGSPSTTYVISGGGGGGLEAVGSLPQCALSVQAFNYLRLDVGEAKLTLKAMGLGGTVIDMFTLNPPPAIAPNGIVNAANAASAIGPGSLVTIYGRNLALRPVSAPASQLQLGGIAVSVNGQPAQLMYASPSQINLLLPHDISGHVSVEVTTPNGSASEEITVTGGTIRHPEPVGHPAPS